MAFSVSPSVIVREEDASASVPSISTPPGAIAGVFNWGPVNEPVLITSEDNLVERFGSPTDETYETFFAAADFLSYSNALFVSRAETANSAVASSDTFEGRYVGSLANGIEVSFVDDTAYEAEIVSAGNSIPDTFNDSQNPEWTNSFEFNSNELNIYLDPAQPLTVNLQAGDVLRVGNDSVGYQDLVIETTNANDTDPLTQIDQGDYFWYSFTFTNNYRLAESKLSELSLTSKWAYDYLFGKKPSENNFHVVVIDRAGTVTGNKGSILETFDNLSTMAGSTLSDGRNNYIVDVIENGSSWVRLNDASVTAFSNDSFALSGTQYETLTGGSNGTSESTTPLGPIAKAYDTFMNANEIDISFVLQGKGDNNANVANYIVSNICETRRDCVAYLSPSKEAVVDELKSNSKMNNAIAYRNKVQSSSYFFMDSGYKYRYDKYNDKYRWVPLNGDIAGLSSRVEPYESPAGYRKGVIKNVVKLAFNPSKPQRDQLYSSDINPVMSQVGQGVVLFGDRTGNPIESAFSFLNVRRLFIAVEKAIATASQGFLFELNDTFTQTQFKNIVEPFLKDIQGRRGIVDFRVIADETVNTPAVVDQGLFRAKIFIKPARSINVIELTFVATRSGTEFDEIVGTLS